ncbi:MAG TPA: hypothetical protein VNO31_08340 [Umezawaea sp.]|nr:hypothetical protein [Umezawaea sp.]
MLTPLVAGLFALAGVTLGVFLEPVKARVAARTRLREDRALRCAQLVEAATTANGAIVWLLGTIRQATPPLAASDITIAEVEQRYWDARNDLKKAVLLIRLIGPNELVSSAVEVGDSDLELRRLWFDREPAGRESDSVEMSRALHANTRALDEFADLARRLTAPSRNYR